MDYLFCALAHTLIQGNTAVPTPGMTFARRR